jgi:hypothetical protein
MHKHEIGLQVMLSSSFSFGFGAFAKICFNYNWGYVQGAQTP